MTLPQGTGETQALIEKRGKKGKGGVGTSKRGEQHHLVKGMNEAAATRKN